jgi:phosphopantothenoylcysteine synthetase/decarboxylase
MRVVITGGPASEPIDEVRSITNHSTGELATILCKVFLAAGHDVSLYLGRTALVRHDQAILFSTNEDLEHDLGRLPGGDRIDLVLHAAALSDFRVQWIKAANNRAKLASSDEGITLHLAPKPKLIGRLRELFPRAHLVGWKYELDGDPAQVVVDAQRQIEENMTDACVVNGRAFGPGFGFCRAQGLEKTFLKREELATFLEFWAREMR